MMFTKSVTAAALFVASAVQAVSVSYHAGYDDPGMSLSGVSCSDGVNGLMSKFPTIGAIPSYPFVAASSVIGGYDSPECGSCWKLSYNGKSIYVVAIDLSSGFDTTQAALDALTGGQAYAEGRFEAESEQVDKNLCGL